MQNAHDRFGRFSGLAASRSSTPILGPARQNGHAICEAARGLFQKGALAFLIVMTTIAFPFGLSGCTNSPNVKTTEISGSVTLDGEIVPTGSIVFDPLNGAGTSEVAEIRDGKYHLKSTIGPKKVSIMSNKDSGKTGHYGEPVIQQIIPVKYNQKSELTIEVPLTGPAEFNFDLKSK